MISNHLSFNNWSSRRSQSLCNESCQNILYKAVFEHYKELSNVGALLLASKSFQNSSFGANFIVNFKIEKDSIYLVRSVLSPSSCFSLQFSPSLHVASAAVIPENIERSISNYATELINTKYLRLQLRSVTLESYKPKTVCSFFRSALSLPRLLELSLVGSELDDAALALIAKTAVHLSNLNSSQSTGITSGGMQHVAKLSGITSLDLTLCKRVLDSGLQHISSLSNMRILKLSWCEITDVGLEHISKLSNLTTLDLVKCTEITDVGIERISNLSSIRNINLSYCERISNVGLQHIAKLFNVATINLTRCELISDPGLRHLASRTTSISHLDLTGCGKITDVGLQLVSELANLTTLSVSWCELISDDGLAHVAKLGNLTKLRMTFCKRITNAGMQHLGHLYRLTSLDLGYSGVSDAGLVHLSKLQNISRLELSGCDISDAGLEVIAAAMPSISTLLFYGCKKITHEGKKKFLLRCPNTFISDLN